MSNLKEQYTTEIKPALQEALGFKNPMRAPRLRKVVVNAGVKSTDKELLKEFALDLGKITGQTPLITKAKKMSSRSSA